MKKKMLWTILVLFVVFGLIFGFYAFKQIMMKRYFATFMPPPVIISTAIAENTAWQPYLNAVGNLTAINGISISPEISGQVMAIYFKDGQQVKEGVALLQIDDATERAQIKSVQAQLKLADLTLERTKHLFIQKASTQASLDDALSNYARIKANVENIQSLIDKKYIRAPFSGKLGIKQVYVGQYVSAGQVLVNLQAVSALNAQFSLPQQDINLIYPRQEIMVSIDAYPNLTFKGYINAIESKVDSNTRTIGIQAAVDNSQGKLYPGMYATLKIFLPKILNSIVLPQTAVTYTLYGDSVFIINLTGKKDAEGHVLGIAKKTFIKTGDKQGNQVVILEGVKAGDIVANAGQLKLDDGKAVAINNSNKL